MGMNFQLIGDVSGCRMRAAIWAILLTLLNVEGKYNFAEVFADLLSPYFTNRT